MTRIEADIVSATDARGQPRQEHLDLIVELHWLCDRAGVPALDHTLGPTQAIPGLGERTSIRHRVRIAAMSYFDAHGGWFRSPR